MARVPHGAQFRWIRAAEHEVFAISNGFHDRFAESRDVEYEVVPFPTLEVGLSRLKPKPEDNSALTMQARLATRPKREPIEHKIARLPPLERVEEQVATRVFIKGYDAPVYKAHCISGVEEHGAIYQCNVCRKYFDGGSGAVCTEAFR